MTGDRYVVVGLAHPRSGWFKDLSRWSNSASIAVEFVKCVSAEEVRARLGSGRAHSALIVDASLASFDRDLVASAAGAGVPVIAVGDHRGARGDLSDLGVIAELHEQFGPDQLLEVLAAHCRRISRGDFLPPSLGEPAVPIWRGRMIAVCGTGGTGASTVAIALAQGCAGDPRYGGRVLLADLALRADQAMLHDAGELAPGLQELVEAHRLGRPSSEDVRRLTFEVPARGYRLLLGLRQPSAWAALRPRAVDAAIDGIRRSFQLVVADTDGDLDGEAETGSVELEERNHLARSATKNADVVFAVGAAGMKGTHSLAGLLRRLVNFEVPPTRIVPVVNKGPRSPRARAELAAAIAGLVGPSVSLSSPINLPERPIEAALRDGSPLHPSLARPLIGALAAVLDRHADTAPAGSEPEPVVPGELGHWGAEDVGAS